LIACITGINFFFSPLDTVSLPNYTGSLGYGDEFVQRLLGNCGKLDVEDCYESIRHLIKIGIAEEGPGKQFLRGGSHGGFLVAHRMSFTTVLFYIFFNQISALNNAIF
jgi:dipeptidyl aminopeptidase/acylaminoacyl peptidase